jgi:hypothetical protein
VVHASEDQFKLVLGKAFCMQELMTWSDEFGNFVILQAANAGNKVIFRTMQLDREHNGRKSCLFT